MGTAAMWVNIEGLTLIVDTYKESHLLPVKPAFLINTHRATLGSLILTVTQVNTLLCVGGY